MPMVFFQLLTQHIRVRFLSISVRETYLKADGHTCRQRDIFARERREMKRPRERIMELTCFDTIDRPGMGKECNSTLLMNCINMIPS
jgi:hypothetical protein